jgi:predicted RNA-binding protein Jag
VKSIGEGVMEMREFVGDNLEGAVEKASQFFGVPAEQLEMAVLSDRLQIAGIGSRVLVLANARELPESLGPVGSFLRGLLERAQVRGRFRIDESGGDSEIVLRVSGEGVRSWMHRDRRILDAMTHLVTRAAEKLVGPEATVRIDAGTEKRREEQREERHRGEGRGGDRRRSEGRRGERRRGDGRRGEGGPSEEELEESARSRAREARESGREVLLPPMNSRERWVVHNALKEIDGIQSESVGEGRLKRVKIIAV